jgi:hypothetical protein
VEVEVFGKYEHKAVEEQSKVEIELYEQIGRAPSLRKMEFEWQTNGN